MTPAQEAHLEKLKTEFTTLLDQKYRVGQAEHGGNVWQRRTLYDLVPEIIDAWVYTMCIQDDFKRIHDHVLFARESLSKGDWTKVQTQLDAIYGLVKPY